MRAFTFANVLRAPHWTWAALAFSLVCPVMCLGAGPVADPNVNVRDIVYRAAQEGKLAYKLTTPEELEALLGSAIRETEQADGDMQTLVLDYPEIRAKFGRMRRYSTAFTLLWVNVMGNWVDIGQDREIVLRNESDLKKFDPFWGFANVSLAKLDLRNHGKLLRTMPFDTRTKWPKPDKMPFGFNPARVLKQGKDPGLGIRALQQQGIDGRGVGIAIIDQPLLRDHIEYADRIVRYEAIDVQGVSVQMHGPPVVSIAVGKTCGVAPAAALSYFAVPMWKPDNQPYCDVIERIIKLNRVSSTSEQIRVVSISTGMFPRQAHYDRWKECLKKANQHGILVVTCEQQPLQYGLVARIPGEDPNDPASYRSGKYGVRPGAVLVPAGNRTTATHWGPDVYTYWREAGISWATPYLAGLAALAYQVNPQIRPRTIFRLWRETAFRTHAGLIVNPRAFVEAVRKRPLGAG